MPEPKRILYLRVNKSHFEPQEDSVNLQNIVDILKALEHRNRDLAPDWYREIYSPEAFAALVHNNFHGTRYEQDVSISGDTLTITSQTDPSIMAIMHALHTMMRHHEAHGYIHFNWSDMPVKPKANAYGGGVAFVTADWSEIHHTSDWCGEMILKWWESPRYSAFAQGLK